MKLYEYQRSRPFIDLYPRSLRFNILKLLFLKNTGSVEAKFRIEPPWDIGIKICSNVPGHMAKMASRPIYGKNLKKKSFFGTKKPMILKLGIQLRVLKYYQISSNEDTGLTLPIFKTWSNLFRNASAWVKAFTAYSHIF